MIEACEARPGYLLVDGNVVSVFGVSKPRVAGPETVYVQIGGRDVFVHCSIDEFKAETKRARTLRKAQSATRQRVQLELDFNKETADQLPTESAAANTHQADEAHNGGS